MSARPCAHASRRTRRRDRQLFRARRRRRSGGQPGRHARFPRRLRGHPRLRPNSAEPRPRRRRALGLRPGPDKMETRIRRFKRLKSHSVQRSQGGGNRDPLRPAAPPTRARRRMGRTRGQDAAGGDGHRRNGHLAEDHDRLDGGDGSGFDQFSNNRVPQRRPRRPVGGIPPADGNIGWIDPERTKPALATARAN